MSGAFPGRLSDELLGFAAIGMLTTAATAALYWYLCGGLFEVAGKTIALLVTTAANTAASRRIAVRVDISR